MAAVTAPGRTAAQHQSLLHFVGNAAWSDEKVLAKAREMVLPAIERQGPIEAWIIDDTGFPKKGEHSVGVARQYCGQLGKQDNCQVAVSLSLANHHASLPVAYRLYLPEDWAEDSKRRRKTGVPEDVGFKTKPEIALEQIEAACKAGLPRGVVLMDAGYGCNTDLRTGDQCARIALCGRHPAEHHRVGIGHGAAAAQKMVGPGASTEAHPPGRQASTDLGQGACALDLPKRAWRTIEWREGTAEWLSSRFARVRVRAAHRDYNLTKSRPEEWLLIEWPKGEDAPTKYWLSTLPRRHHLPLAGGHHQAALAHRARLSGTQAGGRARAFRRARMARLPSPRHAVHRSLRIPDLRAGDDFPLLDLVPPRCSRNLSYPTVTDPEAPPLRPERHIPNSIATIKSLSGKFLSPRICCDLSMAAESMSGGCHVDQGSAHPACAA